MQNLTPSETSQKEARLFALAVGLLVLLAMWFLGGLHFLLSLIGGGIIGAAVWFVLTMLAEDLPQAEDAPSADPAPELPPDPAPIAAPEPVAPPAAPKAAPVLAPETAKPVLPAQPKPLAAPRPDQAVDLQQIKGIGPKLEAALQGKGYFYLDQIAGWSADEVAWMDANLDGFKGRVSRDDWVGQAKALLSETSQ
ncbi:MAG: NADH:ubiquinone oxidoreductase [Mangrovicoccus sp.]|nr:NADH:ubiquinone oxidoreductase [Mangrovicoccus sp.]